LTEHLKVVAECFVCLLDYGENLTYLFITENFPKLFMSISQFDCSDKHSPITAIRFCIADITKFFSIWPCFDIATIFNLTHGPGTKLLLS